MDVFVDIMFLDTLCNHKNVGIRGLFGILATCVAQFFCKMSERAFMASLCLFHVSY